MRKDKPCKGDTELCRPCDWHGQKIGGERRKARVLTRSPNEGNPTPMKQGLRLGAPSRTKDRKGIGNPRGGVWKKL